MHPWHTECHPDHESIFGDTYHGVPNPVTPHIHPYPTRYHGATLVSPMAVSSFRSRPYLKAPKGSCGVGAILENLTPLSGLGAQLENLTPLSGDDGPCCDGCAEGSGCESACPALGQDDGLVGEARGPFTLSGSRLVDAALGAAAGWYATPQGSDGLVVAAVGAGAAALAGSLGVMGVLVYGLSERRRVEA